MKTKSAGCPHLEGFDPLEPAQIANPYPLLAIARQEQPIFYMEKYDLWVITRREDVLAVYKDMVSFSNSVAQQPLSPKTQAVIDKVGRIGRCRWTAASTRSTRRSICRSNACC
jgi:hypothetical protein